MSLFGFLSPNRESSTETETARYVAADAALTLARVREQEKAARHQRHLDEGAAADADWHALIQERRDACPRRSHDGCIGH
ncbi:hypothetical protein [Streptacidiphilus sp. PAMC 29251]